jgi:hypothetical protein
LFWTIWAKGGGQYENYQDFKQSWDPNTKIWAQIKKELKVDIKSKVEKLIQTKDPFGNRLEDNTTRRILESKGGRSGRRRH